MTKKPQLTPIVSTRGAVSSKAIKSRVNKLAHQRAYDFEQQFKAETMAQVQRWTDEGLTLPTLLAKLESM